MDLQKTTLAAAALAALLASGHAAAQNSGWYVGGGPGATSAKFERGDFTGLAVGTYSVDDRDGGLRVFGGYRVATNLAVELGIAGLGSYRHRYVGATGTAVYRYDVSALTAALAANLPLGGGVSLNGRVGAAFTAARLRSPTETGTITTNPPSCVDFFFDDCTSTKTNFLWGIGAQYDVNARFGIRLDYDNYGTVGEEFETGRAKIESLSASAVFRF
jgi:opacity protein-like surface antigen